MIPRNTLIGFFFILLVFSCEKGKEQVYPYSGVLIGNWINPVYIDNVVTFEKSNSLKDQEYGFSFLADNKFIERQNSSFCGTPRIMYADYEGIWEKDDSIIHISVAYWGGTINYKWTIVSFDGNSLSMTQCIEGYCDE
ncbi:MAG: hypothetical protein JXJ22_07330 [Bacteroidales bacterium]|nr:hypothetical protein [Bacteroidales bacterium]